MASAITPADAVQHIKRAWDDGITVGINPPGLLRTAVELADQRTPDAALAGAAFAAEAVRHMLALPASTPTLFKLRVTAANLSEELQQYVVNHGEG